MSPFRASSLTLPHWRTAYEAAGEQGIWFVLQSGETKHIKPGENRDAAIAGQFGKALLAIVQDAKARGVFDPLPLSPDCQVEVLEFDSMWNWPTNDSAVGRSNLYRKLAAVRLPK